MSMYAAANPPPHIQLLAFGTPRTPLPGHAPGINLLEGGSPEVPFSPPTPSNPLTPKSPKLQLTPQFIETHNDEKVQLVETDIQSDGKKQLDTGHNHTSVSEIDDKITESNSNDGSDGFVSPNHQQSRNNHPTLDKNKLVTRGDDPHSRKKGFSLKHSGGRKLALNACLEAVFRYRLKLMANKKIGSRRARSHFTSSAGATSVDEEMERTYKGCPADLSLYKLPPEAVQYFRHIFVYVMVRQSLLLANNSVSRTREGMSKLQSEMGRALYATVSGTLGAHLTFNQLTSQRAYTCKELLHFTNNISLTFRRLCDCEDISEGKKMRLHSLVEAILFRSERWINACKLAVRDQCQTNKSMDRKAFCCHVQWLRGLSVDQFGIEDEFISKAGGPMYPRSCSALRKFAKSAISGRLPPLVLGDVMRVVQAIHTEAKERTLKPLGGDNFFGLLVWCSVNCMYNDLPMAVAFVEEYALNSYSIPDDLLGEVS